MSAGATVKTAQQQAVGAWIDYLNQLRLDRLIDELSAQDVNLEKALQELAKLRDFVSSPEHILGSMATKHGEIAENAQVYISNARKLIEGLQKEYSFEGVARTAPEDYLRNGQAIQQKFYNGDLGNKTFAAIKEHFAKYPDFMANGGSYEIPKDQYERIIDCLGRPSSQLNRSEANLVKAIREWEQTNGVSFSEKVHPTVVKYPDVQQGTINKTIDNEESSIRAEDQRKRDKAYQNSKPTTAEAAKVTVISAAVEGGMSFCVSVAKKCKEGKKLHEFTQKDWEDIGLDTAKATGTGAIRGAAVYAMTNYTATPGAVASAFVTAVIGIVAQVNQWRLGQVTNEDFILNTEMICMDASVSAVSTLVGQVLIPIPVLGAVIGSTVGSFVYGITKDYLSQKEQKLIEDYRNSLVASEEKLTGQYLEFVSMIKKELAQFSSVLELAFDPDVNIAFDGSIALAKCVGVSESKILKNMNEVDNYFLS